MCILMLWILNTGNMGLRGESSSYNYKFTASQVSTGTEDHDEFRQRWCCAFHGGSTYRDLRRFAKICVQVGISERRQVVR